MARKKQQQEMEIKLLKLINQHPEIIAENKYTMVLSRITSTLTIVIDWMIPKFGVGKDECEELLDYVLCQLQVIGDKGWDNFFEEIDALIKEDIGFTPAEYVQEHIREIEG